MQYFSENPRISAKIWGSSYWELAYRSGIDKGKELKSRKTPLKTLKIPPILSWTIKSKEQWVSAPHCNMSTAITHFFFFQITTVPQLTGGSDQLWRTKIYMCVYSFTHFTCVFTHSHICSYSEFNIQLRQGTFKNMSKWWYENSVSWKSCH